MKSFYFLQSVLVILLTISFSTKGNASDCRDTVDELIAMRRAQQSMLESLSSNHELFSITLESYSDALVQTAGKAHKVISSNMNEASKSFRQRGLSAKLGAQKLDRATAELIIKLQKCIK